MTVPALSKKIIQDPALVLPEELFNMTLNYLDLNKDPSVLNVSTVWRERALRHLKSQVCKLSHLSLAGFELIQEECSSLSLLIDRKLQNLKDLADEELLSSFRNITINCDSLCRRAIKKAFEQEVLPFKLIVFEERMRVLGQLQQKIPFSHNLPSALTNNQRQALKSVMDEFITKPNAHPYFHAIEEMASDGNLLVLQKLLGDEYPAIAVANGMCICCTLRPYLHALSTAAKKGWKDVVVLFLGHKDVLQQGIDDALKAAAGAGKLDVVNLIMNWNFPPQREYIGIGHALCAAAEGGYVDVVFAIVSQTRWKFVFGEWERSFLQACFLGHAEVASIILNARKSLFTDWFNDNCYESDVIKTFATVEQKRRAWCSDFPRNVRFEGLCAALLGKREKVFGALLDFKCLTKQQKSSLFAYVKREKLVNFLFIFLNAEKR